MAFRRPLPARRSFSRGFRRRGTMNWQKAQRPRKWQMGNVCIFSDVAVTNTSDTSFNTVFVLARVQNWGVQSGTTSGIGVAETSRIKRIDIGGVVLSMGCQRTTALDGTLATNTNFHLTQWTLMCDRLDRVGNPGAAVNVPWQRSTMPTVQVGSTPLPNVTEENQDFPTRILWRRTQPAFMHMQQLTSPPTGADFADPVSVVPALSNLNKKLRLPLDDEHALLLSVSHITPPDYAGGATANYRVWISGSVYYRVVD